MEYDTDIALDFGNIAVDIVAVDGNLAAVLQKTSANYRYRGAFARTVLSQECEKLALFYGKAYSVDGFYLAEGFMQIFNFDDVHNFALDRFLFYSIIIGWSIKRNRVRFVPTVMP